MISDQLRTKQGPLARVWLASHWERKLSKSQFLHTNLEKTIDAIQSNQQEEPIALRVSGQLLLGVVRIYSRKTKYLLEDCNEALIKIKLAFKKGDVNMPDIHHAISTVNTITLQDKLTEFDILLPDRPFNLNGNIEENDPILDGFGDLSGSQDFTMSDIQTSFTFGNYETERGLAGGEGVEVGRRENEPGFADNEFDMDVLAEPLKDMNLNEANALMDDGVNFDFDLNDNIDYGGPDYTEDVNEFNLPLAGAEAEASLDTLMQVGIVEDPQSMFAMQDITAESTARRRKRLVIDKVTEIPMEDLHRLINDASPLVTRDANVSGVTKAKAVTDLTKPSGETLGSELDDLFSRLNRKRRASAAANIIQKEPRIEDPFAAALASAGQDTGFQFEDTGYDYTDTGFDDMGRFDTTANIEASEESFMTQSSQSLNAKAHETLENLEAKFTSQNIVKFGELATSSCKKGEAARLFYDVLLLSTKNKIKVKQDRPFGDIQLSASTVLVQ